VSPDNVTWGDLFDKDGSEVSRNVRPGSGITLDASLTQSALWLKIRSGGRDNPVPQAAERTFNLAIG
jgi:hypothetical protein